MKNQKVKRLIGIMMLGGWVSLCIIPSMFVKAQNTTAVVAETETILDSETIRGYCEEIGEKYNICPELLEAIIETESGGNPNAVGGLGEVGLMQIYPKFHQDRMDKLGVYSLYRPYSNILVGADYLAELFKEYGDLSTCLMVYNGSSDAIERGENYNLTEYADTIIKRSAELERLHNK